jgi:hypothetical protein
VDVKQEGGAVMDHRTRPHRSIFGERVTGGLPLEAERIENIPCRCQLPLRVQQQQIHDAFPRTPRYGSAADMFHEDAW